MIAGPSNMAIFGALAAVDLPDLHLMGPGQQTRALPRRPTKRARQ
ncbi:MAG: hypothetical protein OXE79_02265 [Acidimicrobiaceae bacterium]|nr:hypothetical protein [Acidimicrobiaceae bacterium]MCY4175273.1 hypothetical protein [Acidimicrobiaceae bacterium]MCY4279226.1 hypothetical protein [Acidimicrobiaceae bacterium]MCY4293750.1 hypothetical protein [Acidimicrobiaceae bacterium]